MMIRLSLRGDWRTELRAMFPKITDAQLARFAILAEAGNLVDDEGEPTRAMIGWCREVAQ